MKTIKLYYDQKPTNFGDTLSFFIADKLYGSVHHAHMGQCEAVFIGSLIGRFLTKKKFLQRLPSLLRIPVKIWGSGYVEINDRKNMELLRRLDVRACRGFLTLERLKKLRYAKIAKNVAIGDPGLLASRIIDTSRVEKKYALGIIPHYVDKDNPLLQKIAVKNATIIDIQQEPEAFMNQLAECEHVIASAMHAMVAADSLGIPNARMIASDKILGGDYKYDDDYSAFGLTAHTKIDLRQRGFMESDLANLKMEYKITPEKVQKIQDALLAAFPYPRQELLLTDPPQTGYTGHPVQKDSFTEGRNYTTLGITCFGKPITILSTETSSFFGRKRDSLWAFSFASVCLPFYPCLYF